MSGVRCAGSIGLGVFVCVVFLGSFAADASAQQGDRNRARQLYAEGQALFDSGQYAAAEASFRQAYETVPNPVVLKAIATAQERQGNTSGAIQTLQRYLSEVGNDAEAQAQLQRLQNQPGTLMITSNPAGAQIIIDGRPTGQRTPANLSLAGGQHTVQLQLQGYSPVRQNVDVTSGAQMRMNMDFASGATGADVFGAGGDGQGAGGGGGGGGGGVPEPSVGVWVTAGVAAAALISGTVFGFLALSEQSNFDAAPSQEIADRGETFALVADISFGLAAAAAITAVVLYVIDASSGSADQQTASLLDDDELDLSLGPWADPQGAGLAAQLRF